MNKSIGDFQNEIDAKAKRAKEAMDILKSSIVKEATVSGSIGLRILWLGLCSSVVVYMTVRAFMFAL
jgi:hypothetical protein